MFLATYEAKYPKAAECLAQDREVLLTFYEFPILLIKDIPTTVLRTTFAGVFHIVLDLIAVIVGELLSGRDVP